MKKLSTLFLAFISLSAFCQVGGISISQTGTQPDPSAALDINYSNKGFLLPRISQGQRNGISNPALGLQIFDTTNNCIEVYGFGNWQTVSCLCSGAPGTPSVITGSNNPCANANSVTYMVGLVFGATSYTWTAPSNATIIAGQGTNSITVNFGASPGNVTVTANNSCGISTPSILPVTINSIPGTPGTITGNPYPCANSTAQSYFIAADSGATSYTWTAPSGAIIGSGQGTPSILVNFSSTPGNIAVTANNTCGSSSANSLPIAMATNPSTPDTIDGPLTFTTNQTGVIYTLPPVTEATSYNWTVPASASLTAGQNTDSITVSFAGGNGQICVSAVNCAGGSSSKCISVYNACYTAGSQSFYYTGSGQTFSVPSCVYAMTIEAFGAQGGNGGSSSTGGYGADIKGTFSVNPGDILTLAAGEQGYSGTGGGGGGSTGIRDGGTLFIVAGGGGGGGYDNTNFQISNASTGTAGENTYGCGNNTLIASGGTNGSGGGGGTNPCGDWPQAGGGAGINGDGGSTNSNGFCGGGSSTGAGGSGNYGGSGGFGYTGGGGGSYGGGGGGGYSGGAGGSSSSGYISGGGGGSYNAGTNPTNTAGVQNGNGQINITW